MVLIPENALILQMARNTLSKRKGRKVIPVMPAVVGLRISDPSQVLSARQHRDKANAFANPQYQTIISKTTMSNPHSQDKSTQAAHYSPKPNAHMYSVIVTRSTKRSSLWKSEMCSQQLQCPAKPNAMLPTQTSKSKTTALATSTESNHVIYRQGARHQPHTRKSTCRYTLTREAFGRQRARWASLPTLAAQCRRS